MTVNSATVARQGDYFYGTLNIVNENASQYPKVDTVATLIGSGTSGGNLVGRKSGNVFVPMTPEVFSYDDDGNLTGDGRFAYVWDAENRLMALESESSTPAESWRKAVYDYDPFGRRIQKEVWEWNTSAEAYEKTEDTRFLWSGLNLVAELDEANVIKRIHLWGLDLSGSLEDAGGVGGLLCTTAAGGPMAGQRFTAYDGNGNVSAAINISTGSPDARFEYDAFGREIRSSETSRESWKFRFSSKYYDRETDFLYYGYRYYNSETGRWLSRDPVDEEGGANLYCSVRNDSIARFDPFGLEAKCVCGPDITDALRSTINAIASAFFSAPKSVRDAACWSLLNPNTAGAAWDINDLRAGNFVSSCGERDRDNRKICKDTVTIDGGCHYRGSVNYVLIGMAAKICGFDRGLMIKGVQWHKGMPWNKGRFGNYMASKRWLSTGYFGWMSVQEALDLRFMDHGLKPYYGDKPHLSPEPDRPQCKPCNPGIGSKILSGHLGVYPNNITW